MKQRSFFKILSNGSVNIVSLKQGYRMIRHYYTHGTYSLFHRLIADIQGMLHLLIWLLCIVIVHLKLLLFLITFARW